MYTQLPDDSPLGKVDLVALVTAAAKSSQLNCVAGAEWDIAQGELIILKTQVYAEVPNEDAEPTLISLMMGICLTICAVINNETETLFLAPCSQVEVFPHPPQDPGKPEVLEVVMQFSVHFQN